MAGRCGCGDRCNCAIQGGIGISTSGAGTANQPYEIRFDPREGGIIGNGLTWNESQTELSAHLSSDDGQTITFGTDGGLYSSGGGDGPNPAPSNGATVQALPDSDILGGAGGAGYYIAPDSTLASYQAALQYGVDVVYVPVKSLRDGITVVCPDDTLERLSAGISMSWEPDWASLRPQDLDVQSWRQVSFMASKYYWRPPPTTPDQIRWSASGAEGSLSQSNRTLPFMPNDGRHSLPDTGGGYFGNLERPQVGGTFFSDVANLVGQRVVMVVHTESDDDYGDINRVISRFGLASSIIVVSSNLDVLASYETQNIAVGLFHSPDMSTEAPTAEQVNNAGCSWAVLDIDHADGIFNRYSSQSVLAFNARYHADWHRVNDDLAIRGAISGDPVYYSGPSTSPTFRYKQTGEKTWKHPVVDYGRFPPLSEWEYAAPNYRGNGIQGQTYYLLGNDATWRSIYNEDDASSPAKYGAWYVLQGWGCPLFADGSNDPAENTAQIEVVYNFWKGNENEKLSDQSRMCLAFGVQNDHSFRDGAEHRDTALSRGYVFRILPSGAANLYRIDESGEDPVKPDSGDDTLNFAEHWPTSTGAPSGENPPANGPAIRIAVGMNEEGLQISGTKTLNSSGSETEKVTYTFNNEVAYRGGYFYLGKSDGPDSGGTPGYFRVKFHQVTTTAPWAPQ